MEKTMRELETFGTFCPVCGFDLGFKAWNKGMPKDDEICPSCGTQFGYHDSTWNTDPQIHSKLRQAWIQSGMKFKHPSEPLGLPPKNWDPKDQLKNIPEEFK